MPSMLDGMLDHDQVRLITSRVWADIRRLDDLANAGGEDAKHWRKMCMDLISICVRLELRDPKKDERIKRLKYQLLMSDSEKTKRQLSTLRTKSA